MQLLVHGATQNRMVFDWPQEPDVYSYVRPAVHAGYATLAVDRIGHGTSTRPAASAVTNQSSALALHGVVTKLKSGGVGGMTFQRVVWVGHSMGAVTGYEYGGRWSDISAYVFIGAVHFIKPSWLNLIQNSLQPAAQPGYFTTVPGIRDDLWYRMSMADPAVVALDEQTKDTITEGEVNSAVALQFVPAAQSPTQQIRVPVFLMMGEFDNLVCGGPDGITCTQTSIRNLEAPYFTNSPRFEARTISGVGHNITQHVNAPSSTWTMVNWIGTVAPPW